METHRKVGLCLLKRNASMWTRPMARGKSLYKSLTLSKSQQIFINLMNLRKLTLCRQKLSQLILHNCILSLAQRWTNIFVSFRLLKDRPTFSYHFVCSKNIFVSFRLLKHRPTFSYPFVCSKIDQHFSYSISRWNSTDAILRLQGTQVSLHL